MTANRSIRICHLYPEMLNLYGDRGNVLCLVRRLAWRGIGCEVVGVGRGDILRAADFDLIFIGGGQDAEQSALMEDLRATKAAELRAAAADGCAILGICGDYQLLGHYYETAAGERLEYLGLCDFATVAAPEHAKRLIGNLVFELPDGTRVVGFETTAVARGWGRVCSPSGASSAASATTAKTARRACTTATSSAPTPTGPHCRRIRPWRTRCWVRRSRANTVRRTWCHWMMLGRCAPMMRRCGKH